MTTIELVLKIDGEEIPLGPQLRESIAAWSTIARTARQEKLARARKRKNRTIESALEGDHDRKDPPPG